MLKKNQGAKEMTKRKSEPVIIDNNLFSLLHYADEYPENWEKLVKDNLKIKKTKEMTPNDKLKQELKKKWKEQGGAYIGEFGDALIDLTIQELTEKHDQEIQKIFKEIEKKSHHDKYTHLNWKKWVGMVEHGEHRYGVLMINKEDFQKLKEPKK